MKRLYANPITTNEKVALRKINSCLKIASDSGLKIPKDLGIRLDMRFDIKSVRFAGQAKYNYHKKTMSIRLHALAMEKYKKDYVENTITHEVAHIIVYSNYPHATGHGREFKSIMRLFNANDSRCHNYDLRSETQKTKIKKESITYNCGCMDHKVSPLISRRISQGQVRVCRKCKGRLRKSL